MGRGRARVLGLALAGALASGGCGGPLGPIAGGRLRGTPVAQAPSGWSFTKDVKKIQLEMRPERPYSVTLGCVAWNGALYVGTDYPERSRWAQYVEADPRVRLRVGDRIWELRAVGVTDPQEWTGAGLALFQKYDLHYEPGKTEHGWLFRLDPPAGP